jgi:hypothetical protein
MATACSTTKATAQQYGTTKEDLKQSRRAGQNEARLVAIHLSRQFDRPKHGAMGERQ